MPDETRLTILTLPQTWEAATRTLAVRILVLPRTHPLLPPWPGEPAFADAHIRLRAAIVGGLDRIPALSSAPTLIPLSLTDPADKRAAFDALAAELPTIRNTPPANPPTNMQIRKYLPDSYRSAFAFAGARKDFLVTDGSYGCAFEQARPTPGRPAMPPPEWGRVLGLTLRRPALARRLGLLYDSGVVLPEPPALAEGGWLFTLLDTGSDYLGAPDRFIRSYAARIPALATAPTRRVFAAVLFPVGAAISAGDYDETIAEADAYTSGFAKIVHCYQPGTARSVLGNDGDLPPVRDTGIHIGWDDEQVAIWLDRQTKVPAGETRPKAMIGTARYRIDVAAAGSERWCSLHRITSALRIGAIDLGVYRGEPGIEPAPTQLEARGDGDYWLPAYFANWDGSMIGVPDDVERRLRGRDTTPFEGPRPDGDLPQLRYGHSYRFRVRLCDLADGGPDIAENDDAPGPAPVGNCDFRRFVPPRPVRVFNPFNPSSPTDSDTFRIRRPLIGYPEAVFTGSGSVNALLADIPAARAEARESGIPDPDVTAVEITVKARGLMFDRYSLSASDAEAVFRTLYTTRRPFPADPAAALELLPEFVECANEEQLDELARTAADRLRVPASRDVRFEFTAICDRGLDYFGTEQARRSGTILADARAESNSEPNLFIPETPRAPYLRALFALPQQTPSPALAAEMTAAGKKWTRPPSALDRIAAELNLHAKDLTLSGSTGQRVVFGCSSALKSTLAPDHGSVTFLSHDELTNRWIVAIALTLNRDWTWDGLEDQAIMIKRGDLVAGVIEWKRTANGLARVHPDRSHTDLIFLDVVDPTPEAGHFPAEIELSYELVPQFRRPPVDGPATVPLSIRLPMTAPPAQTPSLISAGVALSPYTHDARYSRTFLRDRMLWLEFAEPPANPRDSYFGRVLAYAPDPMLTGLTRAERANPSDASAPALPIDPEPMRVVRQGTVDDEAGLSAMQALVPTNSPRHFLLPLPPGMNPDSPELFGMFTYEFRVGHREGWSTAHGRFGAPLVTTGIQHPLPNLTCSATASAEEIRVVSGYALAYEPGEDVRPAVPATQIWAVLYAQVRQLDGAEWRNVLLGRQRVVHVPAGSAGVFGAAQWNRADMGRSLEALGLQRESPLSVIAIELMPETDTFQDPLGGNLGSVRILRVSPLTPVPQVCV